MEALTIISEAGRDRVGPRTTRVVIEHHNNYLRVAEHPFDLAAAAGLDDDVRRPHVYTMTRAASAEHRNDGPAYWLAVCEAIRNHARRKGTNPYAVCTWDHRRDLWGWFGAQSGGRFISTGGGSKVETAFDPHRGHAEAAMQALDKNTQLARGADKFFSPSGMADGGFATVRKWGGEGFEWVGQVEGTDAHTLMLLKFVGRGNANISRALAFLEARTPGGVPNDDQTVAHAEAAITATGIASILKGV